MQVVHGLTSCASGIGHHAEPVAEGPGSILTNDSIYRGKYFGKYAGIGGFFHAAYVLNGYNHYMHRSLRVYITEGHGVFVPVDDIGL